MALALADIHEAFAAAFPAKAELASLEYVETVAIDGGFAVVVRLIIWDPSPDGTSIRDIKEQQVWLGKTEGLCPERLGAYLKGFVHVATRALGNVAKIETLMPHDLLITNVLKLAKPQTDYDFVKALSVKSRLGKYLPTSST